MKRAVLTGVAIAAMAGMPGCKDKSNDKSAAKKAPAPVKTTKPRRDKTTKPAVLGRSVDWATLAKKQPAPKTDAKVSPGDIAKPPVQTPLATLTTLAPTGLRVVYLPSADQNYDAYRKVLSTERIIDDLAARINERIALPRIVDLQLSDCGVANAYYDKPNARVILCYELLAHYLIRFRPTTGGNDELGSRVIGAALFVLFHELGHVLADQVGGSNAENDAYELAALLLARAGNHGVTAVSAASAWIGTIGDVIKTGKTVPFWTTHDLRAKRFTETMCLLYGTAPDKYSWLVGPDRLRKARAKTCASAAAKLNNAWRTRLKKYVRKPAARTAGPPCPVIANHLERLARQAFRIEINKLSPADQQAKKEVFVPMLRNFKQSARLSCRAGWPVARKRCVLKATRLAAVDACAGEAKGAGNKP